MEKDREKLWKSIRAGDKEALAEFMQALEPVIKHESRVNGNVNDDIAQDIREKLIREIINRMPLDES